MTQQASEQRLLSLHFEGPAIHDGRILLSDFLQFVSNLQSAIERTINVLETGAGIRIGRPPRAVQILSALEVVALDKGSFGLSLGLRRGQELLPGWDIGEQAIQRLAEGIDAISEDEPLPEGFDEGVLMALREAGRIFDRGIETVGLITERRLDRVSATYTSSTKDRIVRRLHRFQQTWAVAEGRLLMADVKEDSLRCRLHPSSGEPILCTFNEELAPVVIRHLRRFVEVRGDATVDATGKIRSLRIRDLEPVEESEAGGFVVGPASPFWEDVSFEVLAAAQAVYPLEDWGQLTTSWPEDADFDSFLEAVRSARTE